MVLPEPSENNAYLVEHVTLMEDSLQRLTGKQFTDFGLNRNNLAKNLYHAPFVVVSHNTDPDPIFNYANLTAQKLFEMNWVEFTLCPSRLSAEVPNQEERAKLLKVVTTQGFIDNYAGIRISKNQRRFKIQDVLVWNLFNAENQYRGQAAFYQHWQFL
jgi:hypothetical protein